MANSSCLLWVYYGLCTISAWMRCLSLWRGGHKTLSKPEIQLFRQNYSQNGQQIVLLLEEQAPCSLIPRATSTPRTTSVGKNKERQQRTMFTHPQSINVVFNINQDTHHTETELAQSAIALLYCLYDFITILFPPFNSQCERWTRIRWF